ncbi:MAG: type II toxin-antitoxin system RelE/ParE family toxin [Bacteroidia bacterium]|nr:type II toxin-antitoxin system RelE/ParE family toxin [Bacteroidia bacterium]
MKVVFTRDFERATGKLRDKKLAEVLLDTIENVKTATNPFQIRNLKKLKGHPCAYRIRAGNYRVGVFIENDEVLFAAFAHRKDIYNLFP